MTRRAAEKSATIMDNEPGVVGIRQFRDHLSAYLERVKSGESLTITEHGKPIATIVGASLPPGLVAMLARGAATAPTRPVSDLRTIKRIKVEVSTQDLIDEVRSP